MHRQPGWAGEFLCCGLSLMAEVCPSSFPIIAPIQTLAAPGAICHEFSFQERLAPGTVIVYIVLREALKNHHILHNHGHTICNQQLKKDSKISQSAGLRLLSDCPYCVRVFLYLFLLSCGSANFRDTRGHQHFSSPPFMREHKRRSVGSIDPESLYYSEQSNKNEFTFSHTPVQRKH